MEKIQFIFKILQITLYPLQRNLPSLYLYTAGYELSIVQRSAAGRELTPCSAGPPFPISRRQTENEFLITHFSLWGTRKVIGG